VDYAKEKQMINFEKNIYLEETEVKPNRYAILILSIMVAGVALCWVLNEIGIFRVGKMEMRIGSIIPLIVVAIPLTMMLSDKRNLEKSWIKYVVMAASIIITMITTTFMTFHTTIMLIFPICIGMLYRSKKLGMIAVAGSILCTIVSPVLGYVLGTWDVPLFQELILIATNGTTEIIGATPEITTISIIKILLYRVFPQLIMVGSLSILMFRAISIGVDHVNNQMKLNTISHRDALTGLYNQNYYKEILSDKTLSGPAGVLFFDVNGLKAANDINGHEYGDILLKRSAQSILNVLDSDMISGFRVGGDEFLVIMEGATAEDVEKKLLDWDASLRTVNRENISMYGGLQCSVAVGYVVGDLKNLERLVKDADEMMYRNKSIMKSKM